MEDNYDKSLYSDNKLREVDFTDLILLDYPTNGDAKNGVIKINLAVNLQTEEMRYVEIEYSDEKIKRYVEKNPSVLAKINHLRNQSMG